MLTMLLMPVHNVDAAVSKVAQKAAFKVAKDIAKDEAINMSFTMVMNYKYTPKAEREKIKEPDPGYTMVCLPKHKKNDICERPMQVKSYYYPAEKKQIENKVEEILDRKTGNSGFLKFLNWFVPVWIAGTAWTVVELLLDGELSNFFSNLAYEALVALGFIKPLAFDVHKGPLEKDSFIPTDDPDSDRKLDYKEENIVNYRFLGDSNTVPILPARLSINQPEQNKDYFSWYSNRDYYGVSDIRIGFMSDIKYEYKGHELFNNDTRIHLHVSLRHYGIMYRTKKINEISLHYNSSYYDQSSRIKINESTINVSHLNIYLNRTHTGGLRDDELNDLISLAQPIFDEFVERAPDPMPDKTPEELPTLKPDTKLNVPSPSSVPVIDTTTGKTVKPKPGSTPDNITWIDTDGNEVTEEKIEVGEIEIEIKEDEGQKIVKNPDPEGIPNMKEQPIPDPTIDPPSTDEPGTEFPEGETCTATLKKLNFKPVTSAFTTAFPFSIPWDIKRFIDNAFSGIGSEKPRFVLSFLGDGIILEIPDYFDRWVRFGKALVIILFDVAVIFVFYRWMKGGND